MPYFKDASFRKEFDYDFEQRWNSTRNQATAHRTPLVYCCPMDKPARSSGLTSYVAVVNDNGAEKSEIIGIMEVTDSNIHWTEPRDIPLSELETFVANEARGHYGRSSFNVLMPTGRVSSMKTGHVTPAIFLKEEKVRFSVSGFEPPWSSYGLRDNMPEEQGFYPE